MMDMDILQVQQSAFPIAMALGVALRPFAVWLARFLGSTVMMGIFALTAEIIPRLLGLGQGLISWGFGTVASVSFNALNAALGVAGIALPSFSDMLSGLPVGILWVGSALHFDKVVFIFVSIPIIKLMRKAAEAAASFATKASASTLLTGGK